MSHVQPEYRAHPTDHAVRRYAERVLGLDAEGLDDRQALARAHAQGIDCGWIRRRLSEVGGIILSTGMRDGAVVMPLEGMTVCVGETKGIRMGMTFTKPQCEAMLLKRLTEDFAPAMERCVTKPMGDDFYAAALSLSYNIGSGGFCKSSVVRLYNAGDRRAACQAFMLYDKAGGRVVAGLVKRRQAERALCLKGV